MASSKEYVDYIREQLAELEGVRIRPMMGEYILYLQGKVVGGVYDDRLLVKPTPAALALMPAAPREEPYPGAKELLLLERVDDGEFLRALLSAVAAELPEPRRKRER